MTHFQALRSNRRLPLVLAIGALCLGAARAQQAPDAGQLIDERPSRAGTLVRPGVEPLVTPPVSAAASASAGPAVRVERFVAHEDAVSGVRLADVRSALAAFEGRDLDLAGLEQAAAAVTRVYQQAGFFLARAYLPEQAIADGVVSLQVLVGRIDAVEPHAAPGTRLATDRARSMLASSARPGTLARRADVERGLLLLNDIPGVRARATLAPAAGAGGVRLDADIVEGPLWSGSVDADNHGNRYTGEFRAGAEVRLNDPTGRGDAAFARLQASSGMAVVRAGYSTLLGVDGLRAGVTASALNYRLGGDFAALGARGSVREIGLNASYPLRRTRTSNLFAAAYVGHRRLFNEANGQSVSDKSLSTATLSLSADMSDDFGRGGQSIGWLGITAGRVDLDRNAADAAADAVGPRTAGSFAKWGYALSRQQNLTDRIDLLLRLSGQGAGKNLDSSEQFFLGGPYGVRGYPVGEAYGDEGHLASAELRWTPAAAWRLAAFYDRGQIRRRRNDLGSASIVNAYALSSAGVSAQFVVPGNFIAQLIVARPLGANPGQSPAGVNSDGRPSATRAWLMVSKSF